MYGFALTQAPHGTSMPQSGRSAKYHLLPMHLVPASHDHRNNLKRAVLGGRIIDLTNEPITQPFCEMTVERPACDRAVILVRQSNLVYHDQPPVLSLRAFRNTSQVLPAAISLRTTSRAEHDYRRRL